MSKFVEEVLTEEHRAVLKEAFDVFARDGDLSTSELGFVMSSLGQNLTNKELRKIINEIDVDSDGKISFEEFLYMMASNVEKVRASQKLREVFEVFDVDRVGVISAFVLKQLMESLGEKLTDQEAEEMIREADSDGDGVVSYEDFMNLVASKGSFLQGKVK